MGRTLIIQLERLGDLVQTTPLLRDLQATHPDEQLDLLVTTEFRDVLDGFPGLGQICTLDEATVVALNAEVEAARLSRTVPMRAEAATHALSLPVYDRVLNLTHAAFGCWLTTALNARHSEGGFITPDGEWLYRGDWHIYLVAMLDFRADNQFNLVDLYRGTAPGAPPPTTTARPYVPHASDAGTPLPQGTLVALNPGASEASKRWPVTHFARLADELSAHGLTSILVGSAADRDTCTQVAEAARCAPVNLAGRTALAQAARLLAQCTLLVSNDTGAVHLAAAVGTPVVGVFGATFGRETAPWSAGNLLLQGMGAAAMESVPPALVALAVRERLGLVPTEALSTALRGQSVCAWETYFLPAGRDPLGGLAFRPRHALVDDETERYVSNLRHVFASEFTGGSAAEISPQREASTPSPLAATITTCIRQCEELAAVGVRATAALRRGDSAGLDQLSAALLRGQEALVQAAETCRAVRPVVAFTEWWLRCMPSLDADATLRQHSRAFSRTAGMLRRGLVASSAPPDASRS